MKSLYLHIGLPKTGSTYLQEWLFLNRKVLGEAGVWVPAKPVYAHRLAAECLTNARRAARPDVVRIKEASFEAVADNLTAAIGNPKFASGIISSEYFYECAPRQVQVLREFVGDTQVFIVMYLRRQDRIIESSYNQEVKAMGAFSALGPPRYSESHDWIKLFENWSQVFGDESIRVVNYDVEAKSNNLLGSFLHAVDLPRALIQATRLDIADGQNRSLPANLLEFKRLANVLGAHVAGLDKWLCQAIDAGMPGPNFRLSSEIAREHLSFYAEGNRELARRLGIPAGREFFPTSDLDDDPTGADFTNRLRVETVAQLLALQIQQSEKREAALAAQIAALERMIEILSSKLNSVNR